MSFELQVEFSGLCLYIYDQSTERVAVLMPDARELLPPKGPHVDGTFGIPHAGYVRFNLADADLNGLSTNLSPGVDDQPQYEAVHLLNREVLGFEVTGDATPITFAPSVPELEKIAPDPTGADSTQLVPISGLFGTAPPSALLMRTVFSGGAVTGQNVRENWSFANVFNPGQPAYEKVFANAVRWTRQVETLSLTITSFDGQSTTRIPLRPANDGNTVVRVKVANLCATNPMEWHELGLRAADKDDVDFKWLYRLLQPRTGTWADLLKGNRLPYPLLSTTPPAGVEDCLGMSTSGTVPG